MINCESAWGRFPTLAKPFPCAHFSLSGFVCGLLRPQLSFPSLSSASPAFRHGPTASRSLASAPS
eukprot:2713720-Alexandrium_andersonii.AAC.1